MRIFHPLLGIAVVSLAASAAAAQDRQVQTDGLTVNVETVASGLSHPWGLDFLPDGRMLVTERPGRMRIVSKDGNLSEPLQGVPEVFNRRQGGLLDVAIGPDFPSSNLVYFTYAEPGDGGASTAAARGKLTDGQLDAVEVIFRQEPKVSGGAHFGSRLAFAPDGKLFVTTGERFRFDPAQDLSNHMGTIVRINPDGSVPEDNPFVGQDNAEPEIWSYGHRNVEGASIHPETGKLWAHEMGPRGGDELNIPEAGRNYGWPVVSWGDHYDGREIPDPEQNGKFADAIRHWNPVISPSGMVFYTGDLFPDLKGDLLIGGLSSRAIVLLELDGESVSGERRLDMGARIRNVRQGPDGAIYALTDESNGKILKLTPAD